MLHALAHPIVLIDAFSYLYRSYYIFPFLKNRAGEPTGAIYGFINILKKLIVFYQHSNIIVVFDAKGKNFRKELFERYKLHRPPMPDNLRLQIKPLLEILDSMGIPVLEVTGVEADDVIGTLALKAEKQGTKVFIGTNDKDIAQLVSPRIRLIDIKANVTLGPQEIVQKYGVLPSFIVDLLAMMGDSTDNIPGIPGIGKKSAQIMIKNIGSMRDIYDNLDKVANLPFRGAKNTVRKLEENYNIAFLSYRLVSLKTDVSLILENLKNKPLNVYSLTKLFIRYEFYSWVKELQQGKYFINNFNNYL